ncbi:MAG: hypothetical protein N4A59_06190 [Marinifilum sp.]|jgi:hypothetical protein|nr:hypothetical protein [Marinifilum sp.]
MILNVKYYGHGSQEQKIEAVKFIDEIQSCVEAYASGSERMNNKKLNALILEFQSEKIKIYTHPEKNIIGISAGMMKLLEIEDVFY